MNSVFCKVLCVSDLNDQFCSKMDKDDDVLTLQLSVVFIIFHSIQSTIMNVYYRAKFQRSNCES